jgi:hypothetical protein
MQTFLDSKELAKAKDVNNLFRQNNNFKLSDKAEVRALLRSNSPGIV